MSGFSKIYVLGGEGGFMGADGVNPISMLILVGDAGRQWLEPKYFDNSLKPIGRIRSIVPKGPDHPNSLLDACIAFCPGLFEKCPSMNEAKQKLKEARQLDFDLQYDEFSDVWERLREEAKPIFKDLSIWEGNLVRVKKNE